MIKRIFITLAIVILGITMSVQSTFAHVVVKPQEVGIATFQTFTMSVPNEKDNPTIALRLVVPHGLNYVSPTVKPGWTIDTKKSGEGEKAIVTEINWTGGSIPAGQRDDFTFSSQVPAEEASIVWKAYQTYEDGTVVSWDQDPETMKDLSDEQKEENEKQGKGPYSQTKIINDISSPKGATSSGEGDSVTKLFSIVAIALSVLAVSMQLRKK